MTALLNPKVWIAIALAAALAFSHLKRAALMETSFRRYVGRRCILWISKISEMFLLSAHNNASTPERGIPLRKYAHIATGVVGMRASLVLLIDGLAHCPQVMKSVVRRVAIDVINNIGRPAPMNIKPDYSMNQVDLSVDANRSPASMKMSCGAINFSSRPTYAPEKVPSSRVVEKEFACALGSKIGSSHDAPVKRIGQRPATICTRLRASSFSTVHPYSARSY